MTSSLGWLEKYNLLMFEHIDSTNLEAKRLITSGVRGNLVILANSQKTGYGRKKRNWVSAEGNLFASIVSFPKKQIENWQQVSFIAALAIYQAIQEVAREQGVDIEPTLKWPNDIYIGDSKLAGVIIETIANAKGDLSSLIVGIGVNTRSSPRLENYLTTCLLQHSIIVSPIDLLGKLVYWYDNYYSKWESQGFFKIRELWMKKAYKRNDIITVSDGTKRVVGKFVGLDSSGSLQIQIAGGQVCSLSVGDVS